jgi:hypothetical protein
MQWHGTLKAQSDKKKAGPRGYKGMGTQVEQETARVAKGRSAWNDNKGVQVHGRGIVTATAAGRDVVQRRVWIEGTLPGDRRL